VTANFTVAALQSTTMSLSVSPQAPNLGQPVTLTATVTALGSAGNAEAHPATMALLSPAVMPAASIPTGTVTFTDNGAVLGSIALNGNVASLTTSALAAGQHSLSAAYSGDANYAGQISAAVTITVNAAPAAQAMVQAPTLNAYWLSMLALSISALAFQTVRRTSRAS
jgi:hypothetical protein